MIIQRHLTTGLSMQAGCRARPRVVLKEDILVQAIN